MKTIKLNAAKSLVVIALMCTFVFADGEQGSGGLVATDSCATTTSRSADGEQGSGGFTEGEQGSGGRTEGEQGSGGLTTCKDTTYMDSVMSAVYDYFDGIF